MDPNEMLSAQIRSGRLMAFQRRDLFTVERDDGITITAVMPEALFPTYDPNVPPNRINRPSVDVEMRAPAALPRIVAARPSSFCGPGY